MNAGNEAAGVDFRLRSVEDRMLFRFQAHFFAVLGAIELDKRSTVASIESWVVTTAELVELVGEVSNILVTLRVEDDREFTLLLFQKHEGTVEGRNEVVKAIAEYGGVHLSRVSRSFEFCLLLHVEFLIFSELVFSSLGLSIFVVLIVRETFFAGNTKLFFSTFREVQSFNKLFHVDLELGTRTSRSSECGQERGLGSLIKLLVLQEVKVVYHSLVNLFFSLYVLK